MADEEAFEVELIVGPNGKDPVDIYFEPTGMMHSVAADGHLRVKIYAPHPGVPELWHGPSDIVIWGWPDSTTRAWDHTGCELDI